MLNESIINIRVKLQNAGLKKSGKNKFAGFDYFELSDFLPKLNELMLEEKMNDKFYIKDGYATLELQKGEEVNVYTMPFVLFDTPVNVKEDKYGEVREVKSMQDIQYLGALNTYYKRYLYLNAFGITDGEVIDNMDNDSFVDKTEKKVTERQLALLEKIYQGDNLTKVLEKYNISSLGEMPFEVGKDLISKNITKKLNTDSDGWKQMQE